jgi:heme/copper-type cytochrome/quinol oxidase subunit 2
MNENLSFVFSRKHTMSAPHAHDHDTQSTDVVEEIVPMMPIVLPVVGAVLMFLLAFIAVSMA